ncbi:MAG: hypothetical protein AUJ34_01900 [Parcubacteria group bacterium CG1_02_41_12]|nr:MAG: hypothetical protein AUJ34_01900 [Parcubacteria group bacterium CG1_02_41_12]PIP66836.1 MAG: hypothetical protein COW93_03435 [Parcubacteria group bacterium CG22_combo_CG10-13_8_21_14_all_41_9]PIQ80451.1 MAG: hypothetical protein COV79_00325 [Parcubacteria group bacterium CG11_big_fil_rev_8_21_14_0_20_41_14]PIR57588.1 MAG: hypothetical protein COU72_00095 [Parcubacteria group bacterium CG10_big_fil_rev_8_21_14_0_10_41_35]
MNNSFLILGREKAVSFAEIYQFLGQNDEKIANFSKDLAIIIDAEIGSFGPSILGSVPKSGFVIEKADKINAGVLVSILQKFIKQGNKFHFGLSAYDLGGKVINQRELKALGLGSKKLLKQQNVSVRLVESKSGNLSSVDVVKNKLLDKGVELCLMFADNGVLIGKTESVQPFEDYSHRDFDRPTRDMKRGMIPPKLARSMINMSGVDDGGLILDPFCGIGTVLQEALLMKYKVIGTDVDEQAIRGAKKNIEWLLNSQKTSLPDYKIDAMDVRTLDKTLAEKSMDAIVTEFDLGPPLQEDESRVKIEAIEKSLSEFYENALGKMRFVLKDGKRTVIAWPYFVKQGIYISAFDKLDELGLRVVAPYPVEFQDVYPLTNRGTLLYGRPGQSVFREILILEKI